MKLSEIMNIELTLDFVYLLFSEMKKIHSPNKSMLNSILCTLVALKDEKR